ncbi:hypothetical protein GCM10010234_41610 [Streptomyces hawaiiensis]
MVDFAPQCHDTDALDHAVFDGEPFWPVRWFDVGHGLLDCDLGLAPVQDVRG